MRAQNAAGFQLRAFRLHGHCAGIQTVCDRPVPERSRDAADATRRGAKHYHSAAVDTVGDGAGIITLTQKAAGRGAAIDLTLVRAVRDAAAFDYTGDAADKGIPPGVDLAAVEAVRNGAAEVANDAAGSVAAVDLTLIRAAVNVHCGAGDTADELYTG